MRTLRTRILAAATVIFVVGSGYIVYHDRPVMKLQPTPATAVIPATSVIPAEAGIQKKSSSNIYAMTDVQAHAKEDSCWTAIDGSVYDLTEWIARHPGGPEAIVYLCGIDGTEPFTQQHGKSSVAKKSLGLLKIGTLK